MNKYIEYYSKFCEDILHTGSRVICNPPPTDTDDDWLILLNKKLFFDFFRMCLEKEGFVLGGSLNSTDNLKEESGFVSYKKYEDSGLITNLLITFSRNHFNSFKKATALAKALNLQKKEDRIVLFEAINRDKWPMECLDVA